MYKVWGSNIIFTNVLKKKLILFRQIHNVWGFQDDKGERIINVN